MERFLQISVVKHGGWMVEGKNAEVPEGRVCLEELAVKVADGAAIFRQRKLFEDKVHGKTA